MLEVGEEETCEVGVETFVPGDEFIGKSKTRHKTALLEPEYGCKRAAEEDTLNGGKSDQTLGECGVFVLDPFDGPVGFFANARDCHALATLQQRGQYWMTDWCLWHRRGRFAASAL